MNEAITTTQEKFRVAVLISGRGSNLEALIRAVKKDSLPIEIVVVVSDRKDAQGLEIAKSSGIPTQVILREPQTQTKEEFHQALIETLVPLSPQLIVLAGFMRILAPSFVFRFRNRIINIHPSLLPAFPGLEGQRRALEAGVKFSGCSVHFVIEEVDVGPIIGQTVVPVFSTDTVEVLSQRILKQEHILLPEVVKGIASGNIFLENKGGKDIVGFRDGACLLDPESFLASLQTPTAFPRVA